MTPIKPIYSYTELDNLKISDQQMLSNLETLCQNQKDHYRLCSDESTQLITKKWSYLSLGANLHSQVVENTFKKAKICRDLFIENIAEYSCLFGHIEDYFSEACKEVKKIAFSYGLKSEAGVRYASIVSQFAIDDEELKNNLIQFSYIEKPSDFKYDSNFTGNLIDKVQSTINRAYSILLYQEHCLKKQKWLNLDKLFIEAIKGLQKMLANRSLDEVGALIISQTLEGCKDLKKDAPPPPPLPPALPKKPKLAALKPEKKLNSLTAKPSFQLNQQALDETKSTLKKAPVLNHAKWIKPKITTNDLRNQLQQLKKVDPKSFSKNTPKSSLEASMNDILSQFVLIKTQMAERRKLMQEDSF